MTYLTTQEVAKELSFRDRTIREKAIQGELKGIKVSNEWRFLKEDVEEFKRLSGRPLGVLGTKDGGPGHTLGLGSLAVGFGTQAHIRELELFGQRLRDRLSIPHAGFLYCGNGRWRDLHAALGGLLPWLGETRSGGLSSYSVEERGVAVYWGLDIRDQRGNPLFPLFAAHLDLHPCWSTLECIQKAYREYYSSSREVYLLVKTLLGYNTYPETGDCDRSGVEFMILDSILRHLLWMPELYLNSSGECPSAGDPGFFYRYHEIDPYEARGRLAQVYPDYWCEDFSSRCPWSQWSKSPGYLPNFREAWAADMSREHPQEVKRLTRLILRRVRRRCLPPSLIRWVSAVVTLAKLLNQWQRELSTNPYLRSSIIRGTCHACPGS